ASGSDGTLASEATPAAAMRQAELARTRIFVPILLVLCAVGLVVVQLVGGHPIGMWCFRIGVGLCGVSILGIYWLAGDPARFTDLRVGATYLPALAGVFFILYYIGFWSPGPALILFAFYFVGLFRSTRISLVLFTLGMATDLVLAVLLIGGWLRDRGVFRVHDLSVTRQILVHGLLVALYLATYLVAVTTKRQIEKSVAALDRAVRDVAQREALLAEARQELDRALQVGGPGRFTEQRLGSFRLGVVIGRGAMGEVYEAVHVETGEPAAVKLLHPAALSQKAPLTRFLREAQAAGTLRSPHVVHTLEVGDASAQLPYIAMERLVGGDLAGQLRSERRLKLDRVVVLVREVAAGLEAARAASIVHRDLKPHNLFLHEPPGGPPTWKILDFGVSKLSSHGGTLTAGHVVGTPMYMAPEQAQGKEVDHRADVYSLAAVAYRALTGRPPFSGKDTPSILYQVVYDTPPEAGTLVRMPAAVSRVLAVGLAKSAADRYATALQLADALTAAARGSV
ncbi:MAG TPA: serine/threonine-protein kinase, partial [Kofleriaceae bacterium]|nr:serine/threonine-protein kinase [Kofleriaceae bacterium]